MNLSFLSQADDLALRLELARIALEQAKAEADSAKAAYDEILSHSDDHGIPRAKLKKLNEDRVQALFDNGLVEKANGGRAKFTGDGSAKVEIKRVRGAKLAKPESPETENLAESLPENQASPSSVNKPENELRM